MTNELFFYDQALGLGEFYSTDGKGNIQMLGSSNNTFHKGWTHIIPGHFGGSDLTGLFFYDAKAGLGEFYSSDGKGNIQMLGSSNNTFHKGWTHIVSFPPFAVKIPPGGSKDMIYSKLFFYDAKAGLGEFYSSDGKGNIQMLGSSNNTFHKGWIHIIPGHFGGSDLTDLFFYDAKAGLGEFYSLVGKGDLKALGSSNNTFYKGWTHIIPGHFGGSDLTGLFFYDAKAGLGEFYSSDGKGNIQMLGSSNNTFHKGWTHIIPSKRVVSLGQFGGKYLTDLFFYDAKAGLGEFYSSDGKGNIQMLGSSNNTFHKGWTHIISGDFTQLG